MNRVVHVDDHVPGAVYIGRCMPRRNLPASPLANPFKIKVKDGWTRERVIAVYEAHLINRVLAGDRAVIAALKAARGKPLACWCRRDGEVPTEKNHCHGDVIASVLFDFDDAQLDTLASVTRKDAA